MAEPSSRLIPFAVGAAGLGVAAHVIGKAVRDSLYVSSFPIETLPFAFLGTGVASGVAVAIYTRITARKSPRVVAPLLALFVGASLIVAWIFVSQHSQLAIALLYGWLTITGTLVVSSFWGLLSELVDVRTARRSIGLLTLAGSVGGLLGAVATHAFLRLAEPASLLLPLAAINAALVFFLHAMAVRAPERRAAVSAAPSRRGGLRDGVQVIATNGYLRDIALLLGATAVAGTFADFLLKSSAAATIKDAHSLAQFFATFHAVVGGLTLGVQLLLARRLLRKRGLAATLAVLPAFLVASVLGFAALPPMIAAAGLRGGETATRNSFHRAAYELLFVPLSSETKRATKPILDTLLERVADGIGALLLIAIIAIGGGPRYAQSASIAFIVLFGIGAALLVVRVSRGYVRSLTTNLLEQGAALKDLSSAVEFDRTARETIKMTLGAEGAVSLRAKLSTTPVGRTLLEAVERVAPGGTLMAAPSDGDSRQSLLRDLQSPSAETVLNGLRSWDGRDRKALPFIIELLGRDDMFKLAAATLTAHVDRHVGALSDELCDREQPFAIRRRIPRVLAYASSDTAAHALLSVLDDERFEVRYHAARALRALATRGIAIPSEPIWKAVRHDIKQALPLWEAQRLIDEGLEDEHKSLRDAVAHRGAHGQRHVFNLLALVLEPEPVDLAYRSLHADEPSAAAQLRAVALEYLETVLPSDVRGGLWPYIGDAPASVAAPLVSKRAVHEILSELRRAADK